MQGKPQFIGDMPRCKPSAWRIVISASLTRISILVPILSLFFISFEMMLPVLLDTRPTEADNARTDDAVEYQHQEYFELPMS